MGQTSSTIDALRKAVETRDSRGMKALYAADATLTVIDKDNPPSRPRTIVGATAIGSYYDDVCGRDMTHKIEYGVHEGNQLAYMQGCRYADGTRVMASSTADLGPKGIVRQTTIQAWDM